MAQVKLKKGDGVAKGSKSAAGEHKSAGIPLIR